jgi:K+-transporting ATPase ATPase A chain
VIVPITFVATAIFVTQGIVQSVDEPVATWPAIKTLGSVGGGFFNVNSAMPYENLEGMEQRFRRRRHGALHDRFKRRGERRDWSP